MSSNDEIDNSAPLAGCSDSSEKPPMIERLQRIASVLLRLQILLILLAVLFAGLFVYSLFQFQGDSGSYMLPAVAGLCWAMLMLSFAHLFAELPAPAAQEDGLLRRWSYKLRRTAMTAMALVMLGLTGAVMLLSWQLIRTWFMD
jgi:hypothetical protein